MAEKRWSDDLVNAFKAEVSDNAHEIDPDNEADWRSLTLGWAIGKGLNATTALDFANYIRYNTDLG